MLVEIEHILNCVTYHKEAPVLLSNTKSWDRMVSLIHRALPTSTEVILSPSFKLSKQMTIKVRWSVVMSTAKDTLRCKEDQKAHFEEPSPIMARFKTLRMANRTWVMMKAMTPFRSTSKSKLSFQLEIPPHLYTPMMKKSH